MNLSRLSALLNVELPELFSCKSFTTVMGNGHARARFCPPCPLHSGTNQNRIVVSFSMQINFLNEVYERSECAWSGKINVLRIVAGRAMIKYLP